MQKKVYIFLIIAVLVSTVVFFGFFYFFQQPQKLEVDFLNVGQGDSELVKTPFGQNILIDGGPDASVLKSLGAKLPWWERTIDLMILTHPHDDHVAGLVEVLNRYQVKKIIFTAVNYSSPAYDSWLKSVADKKIPTVIIDRPQTIKLGEGCNLEILYPRQPIYGQGVEDLNNSSIVARLGYKQMKFLFMGDAEVKVEEELMKENVDLRAQVIKVSHHGSDTASSEEFLNKVQPEVAVISVGKNDFGLPSLRVIKRLERLGTKVLRTDEKGTIAISSDGAGVEILP